MALPFVVGDLRDRGTFAFHNATASSVSRPSTDSRLACRADQNGDCTSDSYLTAGASAQINSLVDCIIVPDLTVTLKVTRRVGANIDLADVGAVAEWLALGFQPGGGAARFPGIYPLVGVSPGN